MSQRYIKTNKSSFRNKKINEDGIGSNYKTIDPTPISFFHDDRVEVEMFPDGWGKTAVQITCPDLEYNSGLRMFEDEAQAELFARNQYSDLIGKLDSSSSSILESVLERILKLSGRN